MKPRGIIATTATTVLAVIAALCAPGASHSARPGADRPAVKSVVRSYGGSFVRQDFRKQEVRITFSGRRGDLVALDSDPTPGDATCESVTMTKLKGTRILTQRVSDFWLLPRDGRYRISYRQDCYSSPGQDEAGDGRYRATLRLTKVVTHDLVPGGPEVELPAERGYLHVAAMTIADERAVQVGAGPGATWGRILVPASTTDRHARAETLDSDNCGEGAPLTVQAGSAILRSMSQPFPAPPITAAVHCDAEVAAYTPQVGDRVFFFDARRPVLASATFAP